MADNCLATVPNPIESEGVRKLLETRRLAASEARCDVHMTYLSGDGDDNGYRVPQDEVALPESQTAQQKRKLADREAEQTWHAKRRLRQLAHVSNTKLQLTPFEKNAMQRIQANKQAQVEQFAEVNRRRLAATDSSSMP